TRQNKKSISKNGFSFGLLPVVAYNSDIGFQYGLVVNLFNFGDGSLYPDYKYSVYTEVSRTTRGGGINQVFFDSKHMLPHEIRITADVSYLTELALDFYGFNGYDAVYHPQLEDDEDPNYRSRMYYRYARDFLRVTADLQGKLPVKNLHWLAGIGYFNLIVSSVDIEKLNKGRDVQDILPDTALLYDQYIDWGIIDENEKEGGIIPSAKLGLVYDTRDNEPSPNKGVWSEALLFYVPEIAGSKYSYVKLAITHRQYLPVIKKKLILAYRMGYQGTIAGDAPFFMQNYIISSFAKVTTTDGLGGAKTLRGLLRNRIVADGISYGNIELRWKFFETILWKQNLYLALNAFTDAGMALQKIDTDKRLGLEPWEQEFYFDPGAETLHVSAGGGLRIGLNDNFIVAFDYGKAFDERDGNDGFYAGIGYLF
ncbi:MAG: BamA/TamA family outer membrane protein, partial [Bacteroidales bacterium]|nr:BamA/TamA family outer membrane protein [Bacteroidales bacterium]